MREKDSYELVNEDGDISLEQLHEKINLMIEDGVAIKDIYDVIHMFDSLLMTDRETVEEFGFPTETPYRENYKIRFAVVDFVETHLSLLGTNRALGYLYDEHLEQDMHEKLESMGYTLVPYKNGHVDRERIREEKKEER